MIDLQYVGSPVNQHQSKHGTLRLTQMEPKDSKTECLNGSLEYEGQQPNELKMEH